MPLDWRELVETRGDNDGNVLLATGDRAAMARELAAIGVTFEQYEGVLLAA